MGESILALLFLVVMLLLLASGIWIGICLLGVGTFAMFFFTSRPVGDALATTIWSQTSLWGLASLPLFIWMGEILFRTRLSENLFNGLEPLARRLPGGLLHVNLVGCSIFAAVTGSSFATIATIGKMTIPELKRRNYPDSMSLGTLAGAGTLGLLIPPSITMIVYGVMVQESIGRLFMAGFIPGFLLTIIFACYVAGWGLFSREGQQLREKKSTFSQKIQGIKQLAPVVSLIVAVIGTLYSGIASPTEVAAVGVLGALILSVFQGSLTKKSFIESLLGATRTSSMILLLLAGSAALTLSLGFVGLPRSLANWIGGMQLSSWMLIIALSVFYIILGCFMDGISSIVLTMAVIEPLIRDAGFDMIWFGIFVVMLGEMALITPPVGFNLFLIQGMTGKDLSFIARSALPMFIMMIIGLLLISAFPEIVLWLPKAMVAKP
ncbi:MAG: TRAP transporter large permease [Desulfatirhabdiaceae bacterium]